MKSPKKPVDPVVKLGLGTLIGSFLLIGIGMFLSRPDRSIPPYSIGSQVGSVVAVHIPAWTSDSEITALIQRFRKVGKETRDFGPMKIRPTTPQDPDNRYQRMTLYIFTDPGWTTEDVVKRYLTTRGITSQEEAFWRKEFERSVRGGYLLQDKKQTGWLGPILGREQQKGFPEVQVLFQETFGDQNSVRVTGKDQARKVAKLKGLSQ